MKIELPSIVLISIVHPTAILCHVLFWVKQIFIILVQMGYILAMAVIFLRIRGSIVKYVRKNE